MKATELRIGNLVIDKDFPTLDSKICAIVGDTIEASYDDRKCIDEFKPIELTQEWLIKFGFEEKEEHFWHGNDADWTPNYPRTYQKDFVLKDFIFRYEKWQYMSKQVIHTDHSTGIYICEWYKKTGEGHVILDYEIKYVHQLQNLYFALYGEELTITEKGNN